MGAGRSCGSFPWSWSSLVSLMYIRTEICIAWLARLILLSAKSPEVSLLVSFHETLPLTEGPGSSLFIQPAGQIYGFLKNYAVPF